MPTVSQAIIAEIDNRLALAKPPEKSMKLWSTWDHKNGIYIRNPDSWVKGVDLSGCAVWNDTGVAVDTSRPWMQHTRTMTLVTPRVGVMAAHYKINAGRKVKFVTREGEIIEREVIKHIVHPSYKTSKLNDVAIGILDGDAEGCTPLRLLPNDWRDHLGSDRYLDPKLPALVLNKYDHCGVVNIKEVDDANHMLSTANCHDSLRKPFGLRLESGDSGDPLIMIVHGKPVLMTVWRTGGISPTGASIIHHAQWIGKTAMAEASQVPTRVSLKKSSCSFKLVTDRVKTMMRRITT